jgi:hypothetical protein
MPEGQTIALQDPAAIEAQKEKPAEPAKPVAKRKPRVKKTAGAV